MKLSILTFFLFSSAFNLQGDWLGFRGNHGNGSSLSQTPQSLSKTSDRGWSHELPGRGLSSPILLDDSVYLTSSSGPNQETLHLLSFDSQLGTLNWERKFKATGRTICHDKTCVAASTLASDRKVILAQFSSNDIFCFDPSGHLLWFRGLTYDYPNAANGLGMSSSPVIAEGVGIVQVENDAYSFTCGLNLQNGTTIWKKDRPRGANWTSPIVMKSDERELVALQSKHGVSVIEPTTGEEIWSFDKGASTIPSSAWSDQGLILIPSDGITALKIPTDGDHPDQIWKDNKLKPGTGSPAVIDQKVYVVNSANVLTCASIKKGEILWRLRLKGPFSSSPVVTSDHLFIFSEYGLGQIIRLGGSTGEVIDTIDLEDTILCTPALGKDGVFVRSDKMLWKLSD